MNIIKYINEFVSAVHMLDHQFKVNFNTDNVLRAVRTKIIAKDGEIVLNGEKGIYGFHGIGCRFISPRFTLNYDYTPVGICGGFSLYDLSEFLESFQIRIEITALKAELDRLVTEHILVYPEAEPNKTLYFLKTFWNSISDSQL